MVKKKHNNEVHPSKKSVRWIQLSSTSEMSQVWCEDPVRIILILLIYKCLIIL
jgi:hypothetical protein